MFKVVQGAIVRASLARSFAGLRFVAPLNTRSFSLAMRTLTSSQPKLALGPGARLESSKRMLRPRNVHWCHGMSMRPLEPLEPLSAASNSAARQGSNTGSQFFKPQGNSILRGALIGALGAATLAVSLASFPPLSLARTENFSPSPVAAVPVVMQSKQPMPSAQELSPEELATVKLFQENTPTVVNISNIIAARTPFSMDILTLPQGQGSGFIWDTKGHVVTNFHVIRGASELRVALIDQSVWRARVIGGDPSKDVAVLQLDAPPEVLANLKPISLGQSSGLFVGQKVLAIGNPFGLDHTLTAGIISGLNRELATGMGPGLRNVIQTDAAINPGNSGGPLLDSRGRLVGINTAIADPSGKGSSSGVGFAIPVDTVRGLVEQIITYGRVIRPVLGITIAPPQVLRQLNLEGVLVLDVPRGSPAAKAGLQGISKDSFGRVVIGDVIVGLNGKPVRKEGDLFEALDNCKVGDTVQVEVLRGKGARKEMVKVTLAERAPEPSE